MVSIFNHRYSTYADVDRGDRDKGNARESELTELQDPDWGISPRCWVTKDTFKARMDGRDWDYPWFLSMRDVTNATNERTAIFCLRPYLPSNDKLPSVFVRFPAQDTACLVAILSSYVLDYVARQKVGGTNLGSYIAEQLPVVSPTVLMRNCPWGRTETIKDWMAARVLELTFTAWDMEPFARSFGFSGHPFQWSDDRRFELTCELNAACFHLYLPADSDGNWSITESGTLPRPDLVPNYFASPRHAMAYILEQFPIVRRADETYFNCYRTKERIIEIYDAMLSAQRSGRPYLSLLDPSPGGWQLEESLPS